MEVGALGKGGLTGAHADQMILRLFTGPDAAELIKALQDILAHRQQDTQEYRHHERIGALFQAVTALLARQQQLAAESFFRDSERDGHCVGHMERDLRHRMSLVTDLSCGGIGLQRTRGEHAAYRRYEV